MYIIAVVSIANYLFVQVHEVIVALHASLKVVCLSIVTDLCIPEVSQDPTVQECISVAMQAAPRVQVLLEGFIQEWSLPSQSQQFVD